MNQTLDPLPAPISLIACPVCKLENQRVGAAYTRTYDHECARCGRFRVTFEGGYAMRNLAASESSKITGWIAEQNATNTIPTISDAVVVSLAAAQSITAADRIRKMLVYMWRNTAIPGEHIPIIDLKMEAVIQSYDRTALDTLLRFMATEGYLLISSIGNTISLTARGIAEAEAFTQSAPRSAQGFVAMWFDAQMIPVWSGGIEPAIRAAGYTAKRIDQSEHVNKICDEIIAEIRRSRFLVADFSGHRGGVYYEAGFAAGRNIPVIWTCRKSDMGNLHFDIRQYNCIDWETPTELASRLGNRIQAVIGDGPNKPRG